MLAQLLERTQTPPLAPEVAECWDNYEKSCHRSAPLFDRAWIARELSAHNVPEPDTDALLQIAGRIENNDDLRELTSFLVFYLSEQPDRWSIEFDEPIEPGILGADKGNYMFLLLCASMAKRFEKQLARDIPRELLESTMRSAFGGAVRGFNRRRQWRLHDLPWQMNFFQLDIFRLDRLLFILEPFDADFIVFRNTHDKTKVKALYEGGHLFQDNGQLDMTCGIPAVNGFTTVFAETDDYYEGNFVAPMGYVESQTTRLMKSEWEPVLHSGDWMINIHMPNGPGYTISRFKHSCEMALALFTRCFTEVEIKGFKCDSWLFDGVLQLLLPPETSNIVQIQRQVYIYPQCRDDAMMYTDVFGTDDRNNLPTDTTLQRKALAFMDKGGLFHSQGMVLLLDELPRFGENPYFEERYFKEFEKRYSV